MQDKQFSKIFCRAIPVIVIRPIAINIWTKFGIYYEIQGIYMKVFLNKGLWWITISFAVNLLLGAGYMMVYSRGHESAFSLILLFLALGCGAIAIASIPIYQTPILVLDDEGISIDSASLEIKKLPYSEIQKAEYNRPRALVLTIPKLHKYKDISKIDNLFGMEKTVYIGARYPSDSSYRIYNIDLEYVAHFISSKIVSPHVPIESLATDQSITGFKTRFTYSRITTYMSIAFCLFIFILTVKMLFFRSWSAPFP
jgi:hypothetical protein